MDLKRSKFVTTFLSLFVDSVPAQPSETQVQKIRQAMLDCFQGVPPGLEQALIWRRVLYAPDLQSLWYLRTDVMTLLAHPLGEIEAQARLSSVTCLFSGLLPAAQKARAKRSLR